MSLCLWPQTEGKTINYTQNPVPAAPAPSDLCARPNTLRLLVYNSDINYEDDHDPLLLSADTANERHEWCNTVNAAVNAIREHRKWIKLIEATRFKQEQDKEIEQQHCRQHEQQRTGAWPTASFVSNKNSGKKKKLYK